ncbi:hypothetical protein GCWU000324_02487 [Kingella oralis ATCC 51147]|uniref:Uncharacterized protein n=1 Tax=Kingella oralis ATCC 51147 TaxID=629741 RepID=C4GKB3_9NEIS|nr:hypothetical protein GCWU000324_02487 [Kingella oralis ATCC 51147]
MLKHIRQCQPLSRGRQPPSGGCVLKQILFQSFHFGISQPPSGGCVLKPM